MTKNVNLFEHLMVNVLIKKQFKNYFLILIQAIKNIENVITQTIKVFSVENSLS